MLSQEEEAQEENPVLLFFWNQKNRVQRKVVRKQMLSETKEKKWCLLVQRKGLSLVSRTQRNGAVLFFFCLFQEPLKEKKSGSFLETSSPLLWTAPLLWKKRQPFEFLKQAAEEKGCRSMKNRSKKIAEENSRRKQQNKKRKPFFERFFRNEPLKQEKNFFFYLKKIRFLSK